MIKDLASLVNYIGERIPGRKQGNKGKNSEAEVFWNVRGTSRRLV